jgi:hypothetical protein
VNIINQPLYNTEPHTLFIRELDTFSTSQYKALDDNLITKLSQTFIGNTQPLKQVNNNQWQFKFVGLLIVDDLVIVLYPKYIDFNTQNISKCELESKMSQIFEVLDKCLSEGDTESESDSLIQNKIGLYRKLIHEYQQYGIYKTDDEFFELDGNNEIDWNHTIEQIQPVINNKKKPFYMNFFSKQNQHDKENIIERIHASILTEITSVCAKHNLFGLLNFPELDVLSTESILDIGNLDFLKSCLRNEMKNQFITHKRKQLESMEIYIDNLEFSSKKDLMYYGTTSYHTIWEKVLQKIFNHQQDLLKFIDNPLWDYRLSFVEPNDKLLSELGEKVETGDGIIETNDGLGIEAKKTLIPDIVSKCDDKIFILDAKYYVPQWDVDKISQQPGVGDVTKQYLYEKSYRSHYSDSDKHFYNALIFPIDVPGGNTDYSRVPKLLQQPIIRRRGNVTMSQIFDDFGLSKVQLFEVSAENAYDNFLGNSNDDVLKQLNYLFQNEAMKYVIDESNEISKEWIKLFNTPKEGEVSHD